jgi:two-component system phosphate regulon sensor histidine kinase PhoR
MAGAVLLAMLLATYAVWREIHRERVLVELRNRFVANVSHEPKSSLTLIRMYTETLYLGRLSNEQRRQQYYQTILRESERLTHVIDNILDFARLSKGLPTYRLTATDLGRTVAQVLEDYHPQINAKGQQLIARLQPDLPPVLHDPHGVTQILLNLIDNVIKHAADGEMVMVALERNEDRVQLKVKDRGRGMAALIPAKANKPDANAYPTALNSAGMRLGLALVRQIAEAHRATLSLNSDVALPGTEVVVSFPTGNTVS